MSILMSSQNDRAVLDVTVQPKSSQSRIAINQNKIKIYIHSPPVDGKANEECISLVSKTVKIAKTSIEIERGERGKKKRIVIHGISTSEAIERIKRNE